MTTITFDDLDQRYVNYTSYIRAECRFATEMVGGQPADPAGVRAYVEHQLHIEDPEEREAAIKRILHEEVEDVRPPEGELPEGKLYGLRAVRKHDGWPYLGDWMIKAAIKQATSRLFIFQQLLGTKGAFAEAGRVRGFKHSLRNGESRMVYLCNQDLSGPAECYFKEFMGRVTTPQGPVSIIHQSECVAPGSRFAFEFRFMQVKGLTEDVLKDMLALLMIVGLGSARSLECGKFEIERAEIELSKLYLAKPAEPKPQKKVKKDGKITYVPPDSEEENRPLA